MAMIGIVTPIFAAALDALVFVVLAWCVWRALGRSIPIAVIPIIIGLVLAATGAVPAAWGLPSAIGDNIGWVGVLLLAFAAGLETRQAAHLPAQAGTTTQAHSRRLRFIASAAVALLLPFAVGTVAAHFHFTQLPGWAAPRGGEWLGSIAIGLCVAVSALPVLIGIVRELGPLHRPLSQLALSIAVIDDAVLWIGLAALLLAADGGSLLDGVSAAQWIALLLLVALALTSSAIKRLGVSPPRWLAWATLPLFLAAGSWSTSQLGLHELLGAYFAGAMVPQAWAKQLPVERIGRFALLALAPLFFGHSGMKIDGEVLGWASMQAAVLLLLLAVSAKLAAVLACPPAPRLQRREALAVGALLQCKGLMEIVAATILRDKGLLSEHAFAALVTLAVLSTLLTGPAFRWFVRERPAESPSRELA